MTVIKQTTYTVAGTTIQVVPSLDHTGMVKISYNGATVFLLEHTIAQSFADALQDAVYDAQAHLDALEDN